MFDWIVENARYLVMGGVVILIAFFLYQKFVNSDE